MARGNTSVQYFDFERAIDNVTVSKDNSTRALVTVRGSHHTDGGHIDWLWSILRFLLYASSDAIRTGHTLVDHGSSTADFGGGIGGISGTLLQMQLDAKELTYEDYEPGSATAYGISRTDTPTRERLSKLTEHTGNPSGLYAEAAYMAEAMALGNHWEPPSQNGSEAADSMIDYHCYYCAPEAEQIARYNCRSHSRLLAYANSRIGNTPLAKRAAKEFRADGFVDTVVPWTTKCPNESEMLVPVEKAAWVSASAAAIFGLRLL
ncbi:hypothetical protein DOTSEDRAFT_35774 [Dothistroma septosporum NZE10]|uniref:Uncharacterized protein n=1 Tax=Dothistroma septosporum (strain NZE10 / CBS 128990) TaxID=675120 RepID=M2Y5K7_DOTSN|nr:hypothetical protein DOTSEDRAFT_35774 [Dothistroma septosporum NZE10]